MLEAVAQVVKIDNYRVWVAPLQTGACSGCDQKTGCSTHALASALKQKPVVVEVDSALPLRVGDTVNVGINEDLVLRASVLMYMLPLIALLVGAGAVDWLIAENVRYADAWVAGGALLSMLISLWGIHTFHTLFLFSHYARPVVVKKY